MIKENSLARPLISVIIPTYNRAYCIERTINSVIRQTYRNWELIIINDGSTDETEKVLMIYLHDSRIRYIYQENRGVSETLNLGIELAKGEYITLLDDDDEFIENKLEEQLAEMKTYNADFSLSNCIKVYDGKKAVPKFYQRSYFIDKKTFSLNKLHLSHTHMMFKASIKEDCRFDPSLPASDDFDLLVRIMSRYRILFVREPLAYINKSVKRNRISNNPQLKILTLEQLINKIETYDWTEEEKNRLASNLTIHLGFWQMMDRKYELGRINIRSSLYSLPPAKRRKYIFLYGLSYIPPLFRLIKLAAEQLWSPLAGRIKM